MKKLITILLVVWVNYAYSQTIIFEDDFQTATLGAQWTARPNIDGGQNGVVEVRNYFNTGDYNVHIGKSTDAGGITTNALDLNLDLSNYSNQELEFSFQVADYYDESSISDAILMSDNGGQTFQRVFALETSNWADVTRGVFPVFDFDELIRVNGLSFSNQFVIRFQQNGTGDFSTSGDEDGIFIDNVIIKVANPIIYSTLPFFDDFQSDTLNYSWVSKKTELNGDQSPINGASPYGRVQLSDFNGDIELTLGKIVDAGGFNTSSLDLNLNLSQYANEQLEFSFEFGDYFDESQFEDGIFFSDDGGNNFIRVIALEPGRWTDGVRGRFPVFDLDKLIRDNELSFSNQFVIRFQQRGTGNFSTSGDEDGIYIDNVSVRVADPIIYTSLPFKEDFQSDTLSYSWVTKRAKVNDSQIPIDGATPAFRANLGDFDGDIELLLGKFNDSHGFNISSADLHLNLLPYEGQELEFSFEFGDWYDETQFEDGIFFSDNGGQSFVRVIGFDPSRWRDTERGTFPKFDLDKLIEENDLSFSDKFVMRFQQAGTGNFNTSGDEDGIYLDNITINVAPPKVYANLPYFEDFNSNEITSFWRTRYAEIDDNGSAINFTTPSNEFGIFSRSGLEETPALAIGKKSDSNGTNISTADLYIDLSSNSELELSFYLRPYFEDKQFEDGIYYSEDGGENFSKIIDIDPAEITNNVYTKLTYNLKEAIESNGLSLSATSVIRFQQAGTGNFNTSGDEDGFILDNISIKNWRLPFINAFSPGLGPVGREVTLTGGNFGDASQVTFNGIAAEFTIVDTTTIIVTVPEGATTGKIAVTNPEGTVSSANEFRVTTDNIEVPINLEANTSTGAILLTWQDVASNETNYMVERSIGDNTNFAKLATLSANSINFSDAAITQGETYFYRVQAINALGSSAYSNEASAVGGSGGVVTSPPTAPSNLTVNVPTQGDTQIDLSWTDNADNEEGYRILRKLGNGAFEEVTSLPANSTSFSDIGLQFGATYTYKVTAFNSAGNAESGEVSATSQSKPTALEDELLAKALTVYPNPNQGNFYLELNNEYIGDLRISIVNTAGKEIMNEQLIKQGREFKSNIALDNLVEGLYLLRLQTQEAKATHKLLVE